MAADEKREAIVAAIVSCSTWASRCSNATKQRSQDADRPSRKVSREITQTLQVIASAYRDMAMAEHSSRAHADGDFETYSEQYSKP